MAVHDQNMNSGKNGIQKAINAGRSAGRLFFSKGASSALLSGPTAGLAVFFGVIIVIVIFMIMTMPMSAITSTKNSYDKAAKFIDDQLYDGYDKAVKKVAKQVVESASKPFDEGGYNCGDTTVLFGEVEMTYDADFLNWGVTHDPDYRNEDENYTLIRTEGEKIEVDEEGERPSDEERDKHKSACTIRVNFYPTLTQESGIIGAYVEAANGVINNMPEEAYEEGYVTDDIIAAMHSKEDDKEDELEDQNIFESEDTYESFQQNYGTKYNSISSSEFQRDFKAFVNHVVIENPGYYYKGEYRQYNSTSDYRELTNPIFFALYNHKIFENEEATETIISTKEEVEDQTKVIRVADDGTEDIIGAASSQYAQECVASGRCHYDYTYKYYSTFLYEMEITIPILYDISEYRRIEFDNLKQAFIDAGLDEDFYGEYVQDALDSNYEHTLQIRGLKDAEERYRILAEEAVEKFLAVSEEDEIYIRITSEKTGHAFTGTPYNYYGLSPGGYGEFDYVSGGELWSMQSSCPTFYSYNADCIGSGSNGRTEKANNRMSALNADGIISVNCNFSCVEFAMMWCYDHYGRNYLSGMGNGDQVVANLVHKHSDKFVETSGPYPGSFISISGGTTSCHIACVDRVWEENGKTMLEISDGNLNHGSAVRIRAVVSLDELASYWTMSFASPRDVVNQ